MAVINLISSPRNISTALMYSFAQRKDCQVIDEPFYAFYLSQSEIVHPGNDEILHSQSSDWNKVLHQIGEIEKTNEYVFVKNMAHHLIHPDLSCLNNWVNVYLIRDPKRIIRSFSKVISNPTMQDIGIRYQTELFNQYPGTVIDSMELLSDPETGLMKLCDKLDMHYDESMLSWEAGPIKEDGIWAKYWYTSVHSSTGFGPKPTDEVTIPEHLDGLYKKTLPYFNQMKSNQII